VAIQTKQYCKDNPLKIWISQEIFLDILQNIEAAIVAVCRENPDLKDAEIMLVAERLISRYTREKKKLPAPPLSLSGKLLLLFESIRETCETRLTRDSVNVTEDAEVGYRVPLRIMVICLERLHDSMHFWHKKDGAKGYLNYASQFVV
jgi:hypothetical protein